MAGDKLEDALEEDHSDEEHIFTEIEMKLSSLEEACPREGAAATTEVRGVALVPWRGVKCDNCGGRGPSAAALGLCRPMSHQPTDSFPPIPLLHPTHTRGEV